MGREQGGAVLFVIEVGVQTVEPAHKAAGTADTTATPALPLPRDILRPGMSAQADVEVEKLEQAVLVPVSAVLEGDGESKPDRVFVLDGMTARERTVKLGPAEDDRIAILSGVEPGDKVVEGPFRALRALADGDVVTLEAAPKNGAQGDKGEGGKGSASSEREQP
jgi:multidrug efflux pump subunit AcrA (membrane-fusion protein)